MSCEQRFILNESELLPVTTDEELSMETVWICGAEYEIRHLITEANVQQVQDNDMF